MDDSGQGYVGREQTFVKHYLLKHYFELFTHIVGSRWNSITYIDGFSGPWKTQDSDYKDTSFAIAIQELRNAKTTMRIRARM